MGDAADDPEKMSQPSFDVAARIIALTRSDKLKWARYKYGMAVSTVNNWVFCFALGGYKFGRKIPLFLVGVFDTCDNLGNVVETMSGIEQFNVHLEPSIDQELLIAIRDQFRKRGEEGTLAVMDNDWEWFMKTIGEVVEAERASERTHSALYLDFCKKALDKA